MDARERYDEIAADLDPGERGRPMREADSEEEVMAQAATHAREVHGLQHIDDPTAERIRAQIHDA